MFTLTFLVSVLSNVTVLISSTKNYSLPGYTEPRNEFTQDGEYWRIYEDLHEVPTDIPIDARIVYLQWNTIDSIPADIFRSYSALEELDLRSNDIESIEDGAFNGLVNLKVDVTY